MILIPKSKIIRSGSVLTAGRVELNPNIPYYQNLKSAYYFGDKRRGYDLVRREQATPSNSPILNVAGYGYHETFNGSNQKYDTGYSGSGSELTVLAIARGSSNPGGSKNASIVSQDGTGDIRFDIVWDHTSAPVLRGAFSIYDGDYPYAQYNSLVANIWYVLVGVVTSSTLAAYQNGVLVDSDATSGITTPNGDIQVAQKASQDYWGGNIAAVLYWDAALDSDFIAEISDNPFLYLKPSNDFIYLPVSAVTNVDITADPLSSTESLSATSYISVNIDADSQTTTESLSSIFYISVNIDADALALAESLTGNQYASVNITDSDIASIESLTADNYISVIQSDFNLINIESLTADQYISVLKDSNLLYSTESLTSGYYISVNKTADALASVEYLAGSVSVAGNVEITANPLIVLESLGGDYYVSVSQTADALTNTESLAASQYVKVDFTATALTLAESLSAGFITSVNKTADVLGSTESLSGTVQVAGNVSISADPLTLIESLIGSQNIGVFITADNLSVSEALSAGHYISVYKTGTLSVLESLAGTGVGAGAGTVGFVQKVRLIDNLDITLATGYPDYRIQ